MAARRPVARALAAGAALIACSCASSPERTPAGRPATIEEIAAGIERHIAEKSRTGGGYFNLRHDGRELRLQLVRIHM